MDLYHDLYHLNTSITGWHVHVKILRISKVSTFSLEKSLSLILVDEKGEKVEAFDKAYANYYLSFLEEDNWYTIRKFKVFINNGPIKLTKSLFKIGFLNDTIVKYCDLVNDCLYPTFTHFGALLNGTIGRSYLIELIGYVVKVGELTHVDPQPIELSGYRLSFVLKDNEGCHIKCLACGEAAIDFNSGYKESVTYNTTIVCVLPWWKFIEPLIGSDVRDLCRRFYSIQIFPTS